MISSERPGYCIGAYCVLPFFVYNAKIEDEYGNGNSDDTHIASVEKLGRNGFYGRQPVVHTKGWKD